MVHMLALQSSVLVGNVEIGAIAPGSFEIYTDNPFQHCDPYCLCL